MRACDWLMCNTVSTYTAHRCLGIGVYIYNDYNVGEKHVVARQASCRALNALNTRRV